MSGSLLLHEKKPHPEALGLEKRSCFFPVGEGCSPPGDVADDSLAIREAVVVAVRTL
jgi:hypothetical protein